MAFGHGNPMENMNPPAGGDHHGGDFSHVMNEITNFQQAFGGGGSSQYEGLGQQYQQQGILPNFSLSGLEQGQPQGGDSIPPKDQLLASMNGINISENPNGSYDVHSPLTDGNAASQTLSMFDTIMGGFGLGPQQPDSGADGTGDQQPASPMAAFGMNGLEAAAWAPDTTPPEDPDDTGS